MNTSSLGIKRIVLVMVSAGILGAAGLTAVNAQHAGTTRTDTPQAVATQSAAALPDFTQITARNGPAVVNVSVVAPADTAADAPSLQGRGFPGMDPNDPFFEFFRRFQGPNGGVPGQREMPAHGQGSGFIVSPDGVILTNAHVVRDAKEVTVKLTDRREFVAKVLGSDPKTDVAVLKIDAKNLPTVTLGKAGDLQVGEWVLAIGSPFGFENSVTAGVVSAKGRSLPDDSYVPFIQTDVAVNPGNSGGPLFNTHGEVIGINSQIFSHTGGYQGLSFAIPIDVAERVRDQIATTGKVVHGRLGVTVQEMNQTLADSFKLAKAEGALVSTVERNGPAARAGLKAGDVILKVNGRPIVASGDLPALVGQGKPGDRLAMEVSRQGKPIELTATLGDAAEKSVAAARDVGGAGQGKLGLALRPLQSEEKREAGVQNGLVVEDAVGPSANAGVMPGDVLLSVNGTTVSSVEQVRDLVSKAGKSVALLIQRDGNQIFIPIRIG